MGQSATDEMFLECIVYRFGALKELGEKAIAQLDDADLGRAAGDESNSVTVLVKHLHGNMMSRWTDFLTTDGEKPWRDRDGEFESDTLARSQLAELWEEGWACLFGALSNLQPEDLGEPITIRGREHSVIDAMLRQLSHYACHVGQIVFWAKQLRGADWQTLSVPRGQSKSYSPKGRD
jgi:hypothetical protein